MKKKGLLITIIILLVILILGGGAFAYIYFATDLLKTDKELFAKYALTLADEENGFFPTILNEYENKKKNSAYENNGSFTVNNDILIDTTSDEAYQELKKAIDVANNSSVNFIGRVDNANNRVEENVTLNYSDSVNLPFKFKRDGDVYGIQADILSSSYIAVENNNLQDLCRKLGVVDVSSIPNKIEPTAIDSLDFTDEEINSVLNNYIIPIYNNLSEDKFSTEKVSDGSTKYMVTLTNEDLKNIVIQMLTTLSNDTMMLQKINNIAKDLYGENIDTITSQDILTLKDNLSAQTVEDGNTIISMIKNGKVINNIGISIDDVTIDIARNQTGANLSYGIDVTQSTTDAENRNVSLVLSYQGINTNNVTESTTIVLNIPEILNTTYSYTNNITFGNAITIEPLENNVVVLNNYSAEQLLPFIGQVANIIVETNANQMNQIGYRQEFVNPIVMGVAFPSVMTALQIINPATDSITNANMQAEEEQENANGISTNMEAYLNETLSTENEINNISGMISSAENFIN